MLRRCMRNLKACTTCRQEKSLEDFSPDKRRADGRNPQCRRCQLDVKKLKRANNKTKAVEYHGGKCKRCGIVSKCLDIYDFHHRDPAEKESSMNYLVNTDWNTMVKELDKCDLLCSNCHKITHWELRNGKE